MKRLFLIGLLFLIGCAQPQPSRTAVPDAIVVTQPAPPTPFVLPTLYPTATPPPTATPFPTAPPLPTAVPGTPIPFDQVVVDIHYAIPGIEMDRYLQGNVSGQLTLSDNSAGLTVVLSNQGGILLEMQQALSELELGDLEDIPENCDLCVWMSYEMPLANRSASGWLQDIRLLPSLENFTSIHLGAHFPPGTVLGLRRSATAFDVAHTLALTDDGRLWFWLAIEDQLSEPLAEPVIASLQAELDALPLGDLADRYTAVCEETPRETLRLNPEGESQQISLTCPELSLPTTLQPLYLQMDALMGSLLREKLAGESRPDFPRPQRPLTLASILFYGRADGAQLTLAADGQLTAQTSAGALFTETLTAGQVISLTTDLLESGGLNAGVGALTAAADWEHVLVVRGQDGLSDAGWNETIPTALAPFVTQLEGWLEELIGGEDEG